MTYKGMYDKPANRCKCLKVVIKENILEDEHIFINTLDRLDDMNNDKWNIFDEYTIDNIFNVYTGKEKVVQVWHEDGLCIILK